MPRGSHRDRWRLRLLDEESAARAILLEPKASGREQRRVGDTRPVDEAITYIENHHTRMNYAAIRAAGLPIGSGSVEGSCKTLVQLRMKRAGSRWHTNTGRHVLQLRALATSDRWDHAMARTAAAQVVPAGRVIRMRATPAHCRCDHRSN